MTSFNVFQAIKTKILEVIDRWAAVILSATKLSYCIPKLFYYIQNLFSKSILFQTNLKNAFLRVKLSYRFGKLTYCIVPHLETPHEKLLVSYQNYLPNRLKVLEIYLSFFLNYIQKLPYCILTGQFVIS